jgi:hypothetical protein
LLPPAKPPVIEIGFRFDEAFDQRESMLYFAEASDDIIVPGDVAG